MMMLFALAICVFQWDVPNVFVPLFVFFSFNFLIAWASNSPKKNRESPTCFLFVEEFVLVLSILCASILIFLLLGLARERWGCPQHALGAVFVFVYMYVLWLLRV